MKVVKVYGALRKKLGQCRFQFDVDTPAQAFKALCVNFPGLDKWLLDSEKDGVGYRVTIGKEKLNDENALLLVAPFSEREVFSITPVIAGAGGNVGASIGIGVGLIFASFLLPGAGLFGATSLFGATAATAGTAGALTTLGVALSGLGASLVLGGIAQAISPAPVMSSATNNPMERGRDAAKFESFTFSGIVNTAKQGLPVPIAYGRLFVGSAVLSSGLDVDQIL
jgi:predicted phage tail protein